MPSSAAPWPKYPLVYEINTRIWLAELSARAGRPLTLDTVPNDEIDRIARLGFHGVWLMGVWTTGPEAIDIARTHPDLQREYRNALSDFTPADVIGSPYAISTYTVSPLLGGPKALAGLRQKLGRNGLRLMLDFVCNHTARDHHYVRDHPEYFIQGSAEDLAREPQNFFRTAGGMILAHGRDPYFPGWTDTAQVNYCHAGARQAMRDKMFSIADQCDAIRCDMAMLILPDVIQRIWGPRLGAAPVRESFWRESIPQVLQRCPHVLFVAEAYWNTEWQMQQEGFHFTYDKTLYDRLRKGDTGGVNLHLQAQPAFQDRCLRFIENHDEPRAASAFGPAPSRSAAMATFFSPGMRLFHEGQLEGHRIRTPVQLGRRAFESEDVEIALFYERALSVLQDPIFQDGTFKLLAANSTGYGDASNQSLLALSWTPTGKASNAFLGYLIVANMSGQRAYGRVPLPNDVYTAGSTYIFYDRYEGKRYERDGSELAWPGLYVSLEGNQPHIFEISRK
jgi:hypothetical protein